MMKNINIKVVDDFGTEWDKFSQSEISLSDLKKSWNQYFEIFPFDELDSNAEGFDMGCGSGRWAKFVAEKVNLLNCIDPSEKALEIAKKNLSDFTNINFYNASVSDNVIHENSQDFGYCLGVLHHIPDTQKGLNDCAKLLKRGSPFLLYLYYNFENRSFVFKTIWKASDLFRKFCSLLPSKPKIFITTTIAYLVYLPLAKIALVLENLGLNVDNFPLSDYRTKTIYFMKTDALDRFGTRLEKRFSKIEITKMLEDAGFVDIRFSEKIPMWVCVSRKR